MNVWPNVSTDYSAAKYGPIVHGAVVQAYLHPTTEEQMAGMIALAAGLCGIPGLPRYPGRIWTEAAQAALNALTEAL